MPNSNWGYSERAVSMKSSIIRDLLKITKKPGVISFGGGLPASELFPVEEIIDICSNVLRERPHEALQYGTTEGYPPLREIISERMNKIGVPCTPDEVMITGGSQQGLDMAGRVFLDPGTAIVSARPTYLGAIQAFKAYDPQFITLHSDDDGMSVDGLEEIIIKNKPRLIYTVPTFQNPDGRTISVERREVIIDLARRYHIPVIEDDPYSELSFEGEVPKHLRAMAPESVILLGTFSKLLAPGLRVAWVIAPKGDCYNRFVRMKQGADLFTNALSQHIIYDFLKNGLIDGHLDKVRSVYSKRRNIMVKEMKEHLPEGVTFTEPTGGLFLWVILPEGVDTAALLPKAVEKKVAYVPGSAFFPDGGGKNTMRLNYSKPSDEEIVIGIERLAELFKEELSTKR